jgi:hypothetical protein
MARPLLFRFREWLADRFGFQYPEQRVSARQPLSAADKARMRNAGLQLFAALCLLIAAFRQRDGHLYLFALLLLLAILATCPLAFLI